jgi:hypothetical protein
MSDMPSLAEALPGFIAFVVGVVAFAVVAMMALIIHLTRVR